ncbi:MAG: hypothetical protein HYX51_04825 [Chloroflexi bacterium]|nr:hypothetical protein [Chloroflexota bacterium]
MSATRTVRPTDLVALVSFDGRVYANEARTWERLGHDPESPRLLGSAVEQWFSFATGRHTCISIHGQTILGLASARRRGARAAWEIDCLIAADEDSERVTLSLLDQISAAAVRSGALKLFLRLEAGSDLLEPARKAGFVPYTTETLLRLDAVNTMDEPLPEGLLLRSRERPDSHGLYQLYNRVAPSTVRMVEATTLPEWQAAAERRSVGRGAADVVAERDGRIVAWVRTTRSGDAGRLDLVLDPEIWIAAPALIAWALRDLGTRRPLFAAVPAYARPIAERLQDAGFALAGEYELLAKRLVLPVLVRKPARATVKPAVTV